MLTRVYYCCESSFGNYISSCQPQADGLDYLHSVLCHSVSVYTLHVYMVCAYMCVHICVCVHMHTVK